MENEHPWEKEDDDDIDELIARRKNNNKNVDSIGEHHHQQDKEELKVDEDEKETEISEFCVYYDTEKDIGKSDVPVNNHIPVNNRENENGVHSVISKQNGEHQKHEMSFDGDNSVPSYINNKTEITDDDEITEYDVETVLKKQDTHDLFCPNCNSCITKRVILRKRKRRIPAPGEDAKRSKPVSSELNAVLDDSGDNQALNGVDSRLDDVQQPISDEQDHQREPDVFRCLSCFSIFMPTGNGFKLFRVFGNKNSEENSLHSEKEVSVKKSWFSNFWGSEKVEHNATDLNDSGAVQSLDAENDIVGVSSISSNLNPSMQEANSHTNGTTDLGKYQLQSGKGIRESNGKMATDTQEQLLTSYDTEKESNSNNEYPGMFVVKPPLTNMEPIENPMSPLEHDGLKLLVPPNVGSLIIDTSQMNQELDITVQTNNPGLDEKGKTDLSFSPPASKDGQLNSDGQVNSPGLPMNLAINGKEHKMDKYSDVMPEVSHHTLQNNVEIRLEEPTKVNKDVLTDKQVNLLQDKGKDAIITIESKQLDASFFQRPPDTLGATTSQQVVEQASVTTETGGVNVLALGLANIFGGLFVISHDLWDLKNERTRKKEDRYQQLLGQRADFPLHMTVSLISYLVFGFLPPVVYGFSFRESNDKDLKLLMVAAASVLCIMVLAAGKAYVESPQRSYVKTIGYYVVFGFMVSGVSYLFGGLIIKLLEKMDIFHEGSVENLILHGASLKSALAML